jgi:hypothetical protein
MNLNRLLPLVAALIAVLAGALWLKRAARLEALNAPLPELPVADTWAEPPVLESPPSAVESELTLEDAGVDLPCTVADATAMAGSDAVVVEISPGFTGRATLTVHHGSAEALPPATIVAVSTLGLGTRLKHSTEVTQSRVVLERCAGISAWFEVELEDGRYGRAPWTLDGSAVRVQLREPARIRGQVLSKGVPVKGALVSMGLNFNARTKADGRYELVLRLESEMAGALTVEDVYLGGQRLVCARPELVVVGPGVRQ